MKRYTKSLELRLTEREYSQWAAKAEALGVTMSEFVRQRCRSAGRPVKARRPPELVCEHGRPESQWPCPACDAAIAVQEEAEAAEEARIAEEVAAFNAAQKRRQEADHLAFKLAVLNADTQL